MTKVVIFDLDGTLIDTPNAIVAAFNATFTGAGLPEREAAAIRKTIGLPLERAFGDLTGVPLTDPAIAGFVAGYQAHFRGTILPKAAELVFPGVADGLTRLAGLGITLTVATSKFHRSAVDILTAAGLRDHFEMVVGADQVTRPKPDAESSVIILEALGASPEDALVVGDTTHDLLMARAAGIRSVAVTYGVHGRELLATAGPELIADTFGEVVRYAGAEVRSPLP
ncbi:hydrolase [Spongiactinospora gelatinilytica]|uniref:Tyrosine-protein kinase PtkA n=1 Tax=Spongiactinospora gelatinilytica TaxID=2666298 RepID=A0A2W2GH69_9ACTN|nr:HAD family hydrolase [Spongiactinospora gelatinilytica]PZG41899.1 hydrolase [Spongiactinospora gelatinilytica]